MKKKVLQIYASLVCFITISCGVIFIGAGMYDFVEIVAPGYMLSEKVVQGHRDNKSFVNTYYKSDLYEYLTDEQITAQRIESFKAAISNERVNAIKSLGIALLVLLIDMGIFIAHWKIGKKTAGEPLAA